jgi:hypothetical protein
VHIRAAASSTLRNQTLVGICAIIMVAGSAD